MKNKVEELDSTILMCQKIIAGDKVEINSYFPKRTYSISFPDEETGYKALEKLFKERDNLIKRIRWQEPDYLPF